jgi:hypothetical protein
MQKQPEHLKYSSSKRETTKHTKEREKFRSFANIFAPFRVFRSSREIDKLFLNRYLRRISFSALIISPAIVPPLWERRPAATGRQSR